MRPPFLLSCAAFFNYISTLAFLPAAVVCLLPTKNRLLWPITIVLFPFTLPFLCVWAFAQAIGSFCAFIFHQRAGVRADVRLDGLFLQTKGKSQFISWQEIDLIRRIYERSFGEYKVRFRDNVAYQIILKSGENFYIDFADEATLHSQAEKCGVATEGFDSRLSAVKFEPT